MSKIKVSDLTNEQLDEWVARAQGWELVFPNDNLFRAWQKSDNKCDTVSINGYAPTSDTQAGKAQAFDLMEKYWHEFVSYMESLHGCFWIHKHVGDDLPVYVCRAVVSSVYGEEVEIDD